MPNLITIVDRPIGQKALPSVGARELHEKLGVRTKYPDWIKRITDSGDWREHHDFEVFLISEKNSTGGRPETDAALSIQMGEHIAMLTRTTKGREIREYFRKARDERDAVGAAALLDGDMIVQMAMAYREQQRHILALQAEQVSQREALITSQAQTIEALSTAQRAESKTDILFDAQSMTVQEFVLKNGLLRQFPEGQWSAISRWISNFCNLYGLSFVPKPVVGQRWADENSYPIQAIMAWVRHEKKRPQQITLVRPPDEGKKNA